MTNTTDLTSNRDGISAFIVCCNEEKQIERCLKSIAWCDEVIIIDSGSTDNTIEICKQYTDKIFYRKWTGFKEQKEYGLSLCTQKWVLNIDADEEVSDNLKNEMLSLLRSSAHGDKVAHGYHINRVVFFLNKWWNHGGWYPEYRLRLMQKAFTTWGGTNPHEKAIVSGQLKKLKGYLHHYTYDSFFSQINTLNKHSLAAAQQQNSRGKKFHLYKLIFDPLVRFINFYIIKRGFLEGLSGFIVAINEAFYTFQKYAKLWEIQKK